MEFHRYEPVSGTWAVVVQPPDMLLPLFVVLFFGRGSAGPDEDTVDKILSTFAQNSCGKAVDVGYTVFPYHMKVGPTQIFINIPCYKGHMNIQNMFRLGDVVNRGSLQFNANFSSFFDYTYDLRSVTPSDYDFGETQIHWSSEVALEVAIADKKVSLVSSSLRPAATFIVDVFPKDTKRTASLYPTDNFTYGSILYSVLQKYLKTSFNKIVI